MCSAQFLQIYGELKAAIIHKNSFAKSASTSAISAGKNQRQFPQMAQVKKARRFTLS
jgi:hypothetical protein